VIPPSYIQYDKKQKNGPKKEKNFSKKFREVLFP